MVKKNNLEILKLSFKNKESYYDRFYIKKNSLIVNGDINHLNSLMSANRDLIESINTYSFAIKNKNQLIKNEAIDSILKLLKIRDINFSEFVSFWPVLDMSYSLYNKMNTSQQRELIVYIIEDYIKMRHVIYSSLGYSPTVLQVGKDAKAHKESGSLGLIKMSSIMEEFGYVKSNGISLSEFIETKDMIYIETDKSGKKLFKEILSYYQIKFKWSGNKGNKFPDLLYKNEEGIFIVEHKHMKEGGGGQDKQINEIISFISYSEKEESRVYYVSFLDGLYFDKLNPENKGKKIKNNIMINYKKIIENLQKNKNNYFVNTYGFKEIL